MSDRQSPDLPASASQLPGWQGILEPGEQILWQGQPDRRFRVEFDNLRESLPGLTMIAFALFWMFLAARGGPMFVLFGLLIIGSGVRQLLQPLIWPAYLRSRSWYTLTDRRAIIATDLPFRGRRLTTYPIVRNTLVEYVDGDPPSILFGPEGRRRANRPGFRYIADAETVLSLIRRIQKADPPPPDDAPPPDEAPA